MTEQNTQTSPAAPINAQRIGIFSDSDRQEGL